MAFAHIVEDYYPPVVLEITDADGDTHIITVENEEAVEIFEALDEVLEDEEE